MRMTINSSWLSLCNDALARLNVPILESLDQADMSATLCKQLLPVCIGEVFSIKPWKSARKRIQQTPLTVAPDFGYKYSFLLPEDFIRVVSIDNMNNDEWVREGRFILSDNPLLQMVYIAIPEAPELLSPLLYSAISTRLASKLAPALKGNENLGSNLLSESVLFIRSAVTEEEAGMKDEMYETNNWRT